MEAEKVSTRQNHAEKFLHIIKNDNDARNLFFWLQQSSQYWWSDLEYMTALDAPEKNPSNRRTTFSRLPPDPIKIISFPWKMVPLCGRVSLLLYSDLPNNCAAKPYCFLIFSYLHKWKKIQPTYTRFSTNKKQKGPSYTFISSYTIIW